MVGLVIVSHSENLAKSVVEITTMMAKDACIVAAGGLEDGSFGTSFERIQNAIKEVASPDGVIVLMDMGSAVMTTEMVIETMPNLKIAMADAPLVEGAVMASVDAVCGTDFETMLENLREAKNISKLS